jgi:Phosphotransferase enzyme family
MAEAAVIDDADQITPEWLDAVLGTAGTAAAVRSVATEPVGTGQMARTVRARAELADGSERTVVVKFAGPGVANPFVQLAYTKEVSFYSELAAGLPVRTPACFHAALDPGDGRFVLVLEDMAGARPGDQIAGCSVAHAEAALVNVAGLHGPTWNDDALASRPWLGGGDDGDQEIPADLLRPVMEGAADAFDERFAADLTAVETAVLAASRELVVPWLVTRGRRVAVTHGDYRLDNLLFPGGEPAGVNAVDWQTTGLGPPLRDVAFLLGTGLGVDDRRRHERDLVATYHRALGDHGVTGYPAEECWDDYRLGMMQGPFIILLGRLTAEITERGDQMFLAMWRRAAAAIDDLGSLDAIRAQIARGGL